MSKLYVRILAAGGAAVLTAVLAAAPALATTTTTWTIQPGGAITATSGKVIVKDLRDGKLWSEFACQSATAGGRLKHGSGLAGVGIGTITSVAFKGPGPGGQCAGPGGPLFAVQAGGLPWQVSFLSYSAATGVAGGTISHLRIVLSGSGCGAVIDGTSGTASDGKLRFSYTGGTGRLTVLAGGNLHWYNVSAGCLGLFHDGDRATLSATFTISPEQAITSP